jgi:hypothetical protein
MTAAVSPEAIRPLESYGFVTIYDADGNVVEFRARDRYERCVKKGLIAPRKPPPKDY